MVNDGYPLVNVLHNELERSTMHHHAINGKNHDFYGDFRWLCKRLPEGIL